MEEISGLILSNAGQSGGVDVSMAFIALPLFFTPVFLHTLRVVNAQVGSHFSKLAEMRCPREDHAPYRKYDDEFFPSLVENCLNFRKEFFSPLKSFARSFYIIPFRRKRSSLPLSLFLSGRGAFP